MDSAHEADVYTCLKSSFVYFELWGFAQTVTVWNEGCQVRCIMIHMGTAWYLEGWQSAFPQFAVTTIYSYLHKPTFSVCCKEAAWVPYGLMYQGA